MGASLFRRMFELLLCFGIAFAFIGMALWLSLGQAGRWHLASCSGRPDSSFACAFSAVFLQYWWLMTLVLVPLAAIGLFVFMGRREPR
jgi:hypothetical protein